MSTDKHLTTEKAGLIGIKGSGKTNLFADLSGGIRKGLHGYPISLNLEVSPTRDTRQITQKWQYKDPDTGTQKVTRGTWDVRFAPSTISDQAGTNESNQEKWRMELIDGPGETQFPKPGSQEDTFREQRNEQNEWLRDAKGLVITIPAFKLNDTQYIERIVNILYAIKEEDYEPNSAQQDNVSPPPLSRVERVVIAVTMFDLIMFRFRERALEFAAMPRFVAKVLGATISRRMLDEISGLRNHFSRSQIDLRFIATSSWGFHPVYGCANLDPNGQMPDGVEFGQRLQDFKLRDIEPREYERYPYMAADPVIFAALGIENKFLLKQEQIQPW